MAFPSSLPARLRLLLLLLLGFHLFPEPVNGQICCGDWDWVEHGLHSSWGSALGVTTNDSGDVYLGGYFTDTLFWHGQTLVSSFGADAFLAKYDDAGNPIWIRQISGTISSSALDVETDPWGNVFLTGKAFNQVDLGFGITLTAPAMAGCFGVVKYDPNGTPLCGVMEGGNSPNQGGGQHPAETYGLILDDQGDVYLAGEIFPSYVLGGQVGWTTPIYGQQAAIIKYDGQNGNFLWMNHCGGPAGGFEYAQDVCIGSDGQVYAVGTFGGNALFGQDTLFNGSHFNAFVTKLDAQTGAFIWATSIGGTDWDEGSGITSDGLGHIYATGWFRGTVQVGNQTLQSTNIGSEAWIARLDEGSGIVEWARQSHSSNFTYGQEVEYSADHRVVVGGYYRDSLEVDTLDLISEGMNDLYVLQLDSSGNGLCLAGIGSPNGDNSNSLALDPQGRPLIAGFYRDSVFFNGQWIYSQNQSNMNSNFLLARLGQLLPRKVETGFCESNSVLLSAWAGYAPYLWSTGDTSQQIMVAAPGSYWVEYGNGPCMARDSFVVSQYPSPQMNLGPDTVVTSGQSITLDAGNPGSSYIWSTGDTTQSISVGPGVYGVTITNAWGCTTKDDIVVLLVTGLAESTSRMGLQIWPQPAQTGVLLDWKGSQPKGTMRLELFDPYGRKIRSYGNVKNWPILLERPALSGLCYLKVFGVKGLIISEKLLWE